MAMVSLNPLESPLTAALGQLSPPTAQVLPICLVLPVFSCVEARHRRMLARVVIDVGGSPGGELLSLRRG